MITFSTRNLIILAGLNWLLVGIFLLTFGVHLELVSLTTPYFAEEQPFSLLAYLMPKLGTKENSLCFLIAISLFLGYCKGKFILKKTAYRQINRITSCLPPHKITTLYTAKYLLLLLLMISMGITLRFLPIHADVRGFIDIIVGSALINGATHYFRNIHFKIFKNRQTTE